MKWLKAKALLARGLSASDWLALLEAWWTLLFYSLALRWMSYDRLDHNFENGNYDSAIAERLHCLVMWASHLHPLPITCLVQACALHCMAGRRGVDARVCIGVLKTPTRIQAHAWVEVDGQVVGQPEGVAERFSILTRPSQL